AVGGDLILEVGRVPRVAEQLGDLVEVGDRLPRPSGREFDERAADWGGVDSDVVAHPVHPALLAGGGQQGVLVEQTQSGERNGGWGWRVRVRIEVSSSRIHVDAISLTGSTVSGANCAPSSRRWWYPPLSPRRNDIACSTGLRLTSRISR